MRRRQFVKCSALAGGATLLLGARGALGAGDRPNILWLVSEDNSSSWLGCYGNPLADTPVLDRLAQNGVRFSNCFANAPVCAPARFTIHTGVYACSAGTEPMRSMYPIPAQLRFFTEHLRAAGYYCVNGQKTDYNIANVPGSAWDERRMTTSLKGLKERQPFFRFINYMTTHESCLHKTKSLRHDPVKIDLPPYHPDTPEIRHDYAQYYDQINILDGQVGEALAELEKEGLAENTIVFYFSDNGGILPRSKRFLYETGVAVPLIIRFPPKFAHLCPWSAGRISERMVSYVDFAPTILSLAGLDKPEYMQGRAFLGSKVEPEREEVFLFRGRMDEQTDLSRAVRDRRFKYIRNYFPQLPWLRGLAYLSLMPAMQSWEAMYKSGKLNEVQSRYFRPKPSEELYELAADPFEINNLASNPAYAEVLGRMREALLRINMEISDAGMVNEVELMARARALGITPYELVRKPANYNLSGLLNAAETANRQDPALLAELVAMLSDPDPGVRFWAANGCASLGERAQAALPALTKILCDASASTAIIAAEALAKIGDPKTAARVLEKHLRSRNPYEAALAADAAGLAGLSGEPVDSLRRTAQKKLALTTGLSGIK